MSCMPANAELDMAAINEHLCRANIESGPTLHIASWSSTIVDELVTPYHRQLRRIFNGDFDTGGRLFGGWWQTLPRELRKHIRVDGEPVVDVDFSTLHLWLAYAEAGCASPPGDLYDLTGVDHLRPDWKTLRKGRKLLVSAMFTSKKALKRWPGATPKECEAFQAHFGKGTKVRDEIAAIRKRHQSVAAWFECGRGLKLQRTESDILVAALLKLNAIGIAALPIHDSVLVARSHGKAAQRIMEAEALKATGTAIPAKISEV